jgi:hypothetical protein
MGDDDGKTTSQGLPSAWRFKENDPADPQAVGWEGMGQRERLEACLAAALARWPLDPERMRYNPRTDVAFITRANALDPEKEDVAVRLVGSLDLSRSKGLALLGAKWAEVEKACVMTEARAKAHLARTFR